MKVSIIEPIGGHGGLEIYDLGVCWALIDSGCDVSLYTCEKTKEIKRGPKLKIYRYFGGMFDARRGKLLRLLVFIKGLLLTCLSIRRERPEIVYLHIFHLSIIELSILLSAFLLRSRIFVNIHDPISFGEKPPVLVNLLFSRLLANKCVHATTHTQYSKNIMSKLYPGLRVSIMPHSDVDFIYNNDLDKDKCKANLGLDARFKYVLFFGQIKSEKGLDTLLKAWHQVEDKSMTRLLIVGRCWQNDSSHYMELIDRLGISQNVFWREQYVDDSEVPCYFKSADFIVLPYTRIYSSGVLIRSIGYGTPVIVSDQSAFTEIVQDNVSALVFKTNDENDLAIKLKYALGNKESMRALSQCAQKIIESNHSWDVVGRKMKALFEL